MSLQIKCYLLADREIPSVSSIEKAKEIRRFNLVHNNNGLYEKLMEKILNHFKDVFENESQVKTFWLDEEKEFIGFSSDSEFQYGVDVQTAVSLSNNLSGSMNGLNLFKIYILKKSNQKRSSSTSSSSSSSSEEEEKKQKTDEPQGEEECLHPGVVCDGCNGAIRGNRFKCAICPDYDLCSTCHQKGIHKDTEHKMIKLAFPNFFAKRFQNAFRRHGKCPFNGQQRRGHHCKSQSQQPTFSFADFMPNLAQSMPFVNDPEQLKNIGQTFKHFLEPFGIDVDYYVDTKVKTEKKDEQLSKDEVMPTDETDKQEEKIEKKEDLTKIDVEQEKKEEKVEPTANEKEKERVMATSNLMSFENVEKKTVVEESLDEGFNMVDIDKEIRIIKSIEQMKAMGYSDDGGWLTRLVSAKDGNINAVLDTISPFGLRN